MWVVREGEMDGQIGREGKGGRKKCWERERERDWRRVWGWDMK